ncbi:MAG: acyl-CoA dehydrogenase [Alphaproteobacteria bacterium]|nr:acyl-CoA dehydrogenase [Alphaproteobacteria bacterium]
MIPRRIFTPEHDAWRDTVRRFYDKEIKPHQEKWEKQKRVDKEAWRKAGEAGLLCASMPEEYGGAGADYLYEAIAMEEQAYSGVSGPGFSLHSAIVAPYILRYGSDEQKKTWLPKMARGEIVTAIAMTEPGTGSDLQSVKTSAAADGNHLVINGQKTFITNGQNADLVIVVCKTDTKQGAKGVTLVLVEGDRPGFSKGRNLEKLGMKAQDTSELFFADVRVPRTNILGGEGQGFYHLMEQLPQERLNIAVGAVAACEAALGWTRDYAKSRTAFGKPIGSFQNSRFVLAELATEIQVARAFVDRCMELHLAAKLDVTTAAMAKLHTTELQGKVMDKCLQLFGGYGYMWEYPIARAYADARVTRIFGGTNEIMKELISRGL